MHAIIYLSVAIYGTLTISTLESVVVGVLVVECGLCVVGARVVYSVVVASVVEAIVGECVVGVAIVGLAVDVAGAVQQLSSDINAELIAATTGYFPWSQRSKPSSSSSVLITAPKRLCSRMNAAFLCRSSCSLYVIHRSPQCA